MLNKLVPVIAYVSAAGISPPITKLVFSSIVKIRGKKRKKKVQRFGYFTEVEILTLRLETDWRLLQYILHK